MKQADCTKTPYQCLKVSIRFFFVKVCQSIQQTLSKFLTIFEIIPETLSRSLFTGVSATLFHNRGVVCVAIDQLHTASCCCLIAGLNYSLLQCLDLFTGGTGLPGRHSCPPHSTGADHHGGERRASGGAGREDRGPTVAQLQKCADRLQFFCFFWQSPQTAQNGPYHAWFVTNNSVF